MIGDLEISKRILSKIAQCAIIKKCMRFMKKVRYERLEKYDYGNELR